MKILSILLSIVSLSLGSARRYPRRDVVDGCTTFTVASGTGCAWMCNYCATTLGTNNYYFTDGVCTYEQGVGCVGSPITGKSYTCCSV